jgi:hypothetical protein
VQLPTRKYATDVNVECILAHELESFVLQSARDFDVD